MAKVNLVANEQRQVFNSDDDVFGANGVEAALIQNSVSNVEVDQNVETVSLTGAHGSYSFQQAGNSLNIYSGATLVSTVFVQADGTALTFSDGTILALFDRTGSTPVIKLGDAVVPSSAAGSVTVGSSFIDTTATSGGISNGDGVTLTLTESVTPGDDAVAPVTAVYWGYNPHDEHLDTDPTGIPSDGGIPVADLVSFLTTITGLDLTELGLIDANGVDPFQNVTSLTLSNPLSSGANNTTGTDGSDASSDSSNTLVINFADGSFLNAEVGLGEQYFKFLNDLLFDKNGNTRLFEKVISEGSDPTGPGLQPIVLTTSENNGGTLETGFTTSGDDTIVAGRLELLHQAYINGGAGYNTLEIDAKGTYAQPAQLLNIHEVRVNDLPNFYTTDYGDGGGNLENTEFNDTGFLNPIGPTGSGSNDSWIDLSRATAIEKLVVTDQDSNSGALTIVGVRNAATLRLEGEFADDLRVQYGQGQTGTLDVELVVGDVTGDISILQNASVLNIDSQGVENHMHSFFAGGSISRMVVTGTGAFGVDENLAGSFNAGRPAIIDATANTGGLDVTLNGHYNVTVKGTQADDEITAQDSTKVTITASNGNNVVDVDGSSIVNIATGTGDDTITAQDGDEVTIAASSGKNNITTDGSSVVTITTGTGNDTISAQDGTTVTISAGDGNNSINANGDIDAERVVSITTGAGNDIISATRAGSVTIEAGNGTNKIIVSANTIDITTGTGNDTLTLSGMDTTFDLGDDEADGGGAGGFNTGNQSDLDNSHFYDNLAPGAMLTLNLGAGTNTVNLGRDVTDLDGSPDVDAQFGVTALEGSVITGSGIKLFVENNSDLTQADLTGAAISSVVLKQELRITAEQFSDIGASAFSALLDEEGATEDLYIVASSNVTLSQLVDLTQLSTAVRLHFELENGATLSLTATELHTYFAKDGVISDDGLNGKVKITGAGLNFDAFTSSGLATANGVIDGGSLTSDFDDSDDVTIVRSVDGFERPTPGASTDTLTIDSDLTPVVSTAVISEVATLKIIGDADITFNKAVDLGRDADAATLADGRKGDTVSPETDAFTIDFTGLTGDLNDLTIANFQDVRQVKGTVIEGRDVRIDVELTNGSTVGAVGNGNGLKSTGVQTYVVTAIGDDSVGEDSAASSATIYVCDLTKNVTTLGLQGNYNDTINFLQVNWGTNFLLEGGGTAKADGNPSFANIGTLNATYFWSAAAPFANAVVDIVNLDAAGSVRPVHVAGIDIDNADSITVNVAGDTDLIIETISGSELDDLTFVSAGNVTVRDLENAVLDTLDASDVDGTFTLEISNWHDVDLSGTEVSGLDAVIFSGDNGDLTVTTTQLLDLGIANITTTSDATNSELHVTEYAGEAIDFTAIDVTNVEDVTFSDSAASPIVVNSATVFGNFDFAVQELIIVAENSDTTVEMTAAQFLQLESNGTVTASTDHSVATGVEFEADLVITDLAADEVLVLSDVSAAGADGVTVVVRVEGVVATEDMSITGHNIILEVAGGANDLTDADVATIADVHFTADATLTLTAAQVAAIDVDDFSVDAGVTVTLNITDLSDLQELDLDVIQDAGINIGTITILDVNATEILDSGTTLGGADSIIVPTGVTLQLTAEQFEGLEGAGTITGSGTVNITDLTNDEDTIDLSGVTADHGTITLDAATVTLDAAADLGDFAIQLASGQMIQFATAEQADGATINEVVNGTTTAVAWLFDTLGAVTQIDTSNYDGDINTLFINEDLVDGVNEEGLWTFLDGDIVVEKTNVNDIPDVLIAIDRTNTFAALTAIAGVSYDDQAEFQTIQDLTINLEGNTNIGDVTIGDTNGEGDFQTLTINSYEDRSTLGNADNGFDFQPNIVGDISLNAGTADELLNVTLNTYDDVDNIINSIATPSADDANGFFDAENVNGANAERDGLDLEVGTITFAANTTSTATLTLTGANDITIAGLDISDAQVNLLHVEGTALDSAVELNINGVDYHNVDLDSDNDSNDQVAVNDLWLIDTNVANGTDIGSVADVDLLQVVGGTLDLTNADLDVEYVNFTADATVTLTAAQVLAIGAGNFTKAAAANVTINVVGVGAGAIDLNVIEDAGFNLGSVTVSASAELAAGTTFGGADQVTIAVDSANVNLEMTAAQYLTINNGNIVETRTADAIADGFSGSVTIDALEAIENATTGLVTIDLSTVVTTGTNTVEISNNGATVAGGNGDVELTDATLLGDFTVVLVDLPGTGAADEAVGETIRFANAVQAERAVTVTGFDGLVGAGTNGEEDTNVVWLFDTITGTATAGKVDTSDYSSELGRVWMLDQLVDGANVEELVTSLSGDIIVHVVNSADLDELLPESTGFSRTVEVEAFTQLPAGITFNDIDQDQPYFHVENLTITMGGEVNIGDLELDNLLAEPIANNDEFGTLTINSRLAADENDVLMPEGWDPDVNTAPAGGNTIGDISSGASRGELSRVTINATDVELTAGTIFFSEDGDDPTPPADGVDAVATLTVTGDEDVTIASLNTADAQITSLSVVTAGYTGTLTAPGASPALNLGATTDDVTISGSGEIILGTAGDAAKPGVSGAELSVLDASGFTGHLDLGTVALLDGTNDTDNPNTVAVDDAQNAFTFTSGTLGETNLVVSANTLAAGSTWTFNMNDNRGGAIADEDLSTLTFTDLSVFTGGGIVAVNETQDDNVTVTVSDVDINTQAEVLLLASLGYVDVIDITAAGAVTLDAATANAAAGLMGENGTVSVFDTGAALATLSVAALETAGFDVIDAFDNAITLNVAQEIAADPRLVAADVITVGDAGSNIAGMTVAQIGSAKIDVIDATNDAISLNVAQEIAADAKLVAGDAITVADTGANIAGMTTVQLGSAKIDAIDATNNAITLTVAQELAADAKLVAGDLITVTDTGANIAAMTAAQLGSAVIDVINANDFAITLNVAQVTAANAKLAGGLDNDIVTVSDTGANIATMSAGLLGSANIDIINATNDAITLTAAQEVAADAKLVTGDAITVSDSGAAINGMSVAQLGSAKIDTIDVDGTSVGAVTLNVAQEVAADAKLLVADTVTVVDSGANIAAMTVAQLGSTKIDTIDATDNAITLNVAQETAADAKLLVADFVTVSDTTANLNASLAALLASTKVDDIVATDGLIVDAATFTANVTSYSDAQFITVSDTGAAIAGMSTANLGSSKLDIIDVDGTNVGAITLNVAQETAADAKLKATDTVTVSDAGSNIAAMSVAALGSAKIDVLDATDDAITLNVAKELAADAKLVVADAITVADTSANIQAALATLLASTKVNTIDSTEDGSAIVLSVAQELVAANMAKLVGGDTITVSDTGAVILTNLAALVAEAKVDNIDANDNAMTLTVAQELSADGKLVTGDTITVSDSGANIAGMTALQMGSAKIDFFDATDNAITLTAAQYTAATGAKLTGADVITVTDTAAAIAAAAIINTVDNLAITNSAGTAANFTAIEAFANTGVNSYVGLTDTAAAIAGAAINNTVGTLTINNSAGTAAQFTTIEAFANTGANSYVGLTDTAAAIAGAAINNTVGTLTINNSVGTAANFTTIEAFANTGANSYVGLTDTAAAIAGAAINNTVGTLTINNSAGTAANFTTIEAFANTGANSYVGLTDTAAAIAGAAINNTVGTLTINNSVGTAANFTTIEAFANTGANSYVGLTDTAAAIAGAAINNTVGTLTINNSVGTAANFTTIEAFANTGANSYVGLTDTAAAIAAAAINNTVGTLDINNSVGTAANFTTIEAFANTGANSYVGLTDTAAAIAAAAINNTVGTLDINDSVGTAANFTTIEAFANTGANSYVGLTDTAAAIAAAAINNTVGTLDINDSVGTAANFTTIEAFANTGANSYVGLTDTAAAIAAAAINNTVGTLSINDTATVAEAITILGFANTGLNTFVGMDLDTANNITDWTILAADAVSVDAAGEYFLAGDTVTFWDDFSASQVVVQVAGTTAANVSGDVFSFL